MNDFEKVLAKEIIQSIDKNPELWDTCIVGLRRNDGLELSIGMFESVANVSIWRPHEYEFKDKTIRKELFIAADKLRSLIDKKQKDENEAENKAKLSVFLNLNTRKNKLEHLKEISQSEEEVKEVKTEKSFFQKLFNL